MERDQVIDAVKKILREYMHESATQGYWQMSVNDEEWDNIPEQIADLLPCSDNNA